MRSHIITSEARARCIFTRSPTLASEYTLTEVGQYWPRILSVAHINILQDACVPKRAPINICCIISRPIDLQSLMLFFSQTTFLLGAKLKSIFKSNSRRAARGSWLIWRNNLRLCLAAGSASARGWNYEWCIIVCVRQHTTAHCYISAYICSHVCSITYYLQTCGPALVKFSSRCPLELLNGVAAPIAIHAMMVLIIPHHYTRCCAIIGVVFNGEKKWRAEINWENSSREKMLSQIWHKRASLFCGVASY